MVIYNIMVTKHQNKSSNRKGKNPPPPLHGAPPPLVQKSQGMPMNGSLMMSSIISGFGHGIGMNIAKTVMDKIIPRENKCDNIQKEMDVCFKSIDTKDCYDIVSKYRDCISNENKT